MIAFLTVLGYSLYDTIVVFDKVQENTRGLASTNRLTYSDTVNLSMNQVLARSINTSLVAILPILSILVIGAWVLGATALQDFGLALFVGLTTGAYSSIFIASPAAGLAQGARAALRRDPPAAGADPDRPVSAHHPGRGRHGRPERRGGRRRPAPADRRAGGGGGRGRRSDPARPRVPETQRRPAAGPTAPDGDRSWADPGADNGARASGPASARRTAPATSRGLGPATGPPADGTACAPTAGPGAAPRPGQPAAAPAPEEGPAALSRSCGPLRAVV